jgi:hypothetical protein
MLQPGEPKIEHIFQLVDEAGDFLNYMNRSRDEARA